MQKRDGFLPASYKEATVTGNHDSLCSRGTIFGLTMKQQVLSRKLGLWLLLFYGLGNILGTGIYGLVGKIAGIAGFFALFSFVLATVIASFTALSYAELASRYPFSAGEALYLQEGIGSKTLSIGVGLFVAISGLVAAASLLHGFVWYLSEFIELNKYIVIVIAVFLLLSLQSRG